MALTKLTADLNNHQSLSDQPNATDGKTPSQLKVLYDKAANDIKTYINDTLTPEVDAHMAETAQKHITESGSNANSEYVRFDDGTQICFHSMNIDSHDITVTVDSLYRSYSAIIWTFPAAFISNPIANAIWKNESIDGVWVGEKLYNGTSDARFILYSSASKTVSGVLWLVAIGRWK